MTNDFVNVCRHISAEEEDETMNVRLYPEPTPIAKEHPPLARFRIKVEIINTSNMENLGPRVSPSTCLFFFHFV